MKTIALCVLSVLAGLFFTISSSAQNLEYKIGEPIAIDKKNGFSYAGYDDLNFYILKKERVKRDVLGTLECYSRTTLAKIFSTPLNLEVTGNDEYHLVKVLSKKNKIQLFYSYTDKKEKVAVLMVSLYDMKGNQISKSLQLMEHDASTPMSEMMFDVRELQGSEYIMISQNRQKSGFSPKGVAETRIYNAEMSVVNSYEMEYNARDGMTSYSPIYCNENKDIYAFSFHFTMTGEITDLAMGILKKGEKEFKLIKTIDEKKYYLYNYSSDRYLDFVSVSPEGKIIVVMLYSDDKKASRNSELNGVASFVFDSRNSRWEKQSFTKFINSGDEKKKNTENTLKEYRLRKIEHSDNDSWRIMLERLHVINLGTSPGSISSNETQLYQYTNICEIRLNKELKITSQKYLFKNQKVSGDQAIYTGFISLSKNDKTYIFYNDKEENLNRNDDDVKSINDSFKKKAIPCIATVDATGVNKAAFFQEYQGSKFALIEPSSSLRMSNNEVITILSIDDDERFVKLMIR